nr:hypothetical protein [Tanacetum cinerariifolium]
MEILLEPTSNKLMINLTKAGNPVKNILLKLNLSDHKSILTDLQVTPTKPRQMTKPYSSHRFIANCLNVGNLKMEVKDLALIVACSSDLMMVDFGEALERCKDCWKLP